MIVQTCALVLTFGTLVFAQQCPINFQYYNGRCYYFSREALTWHEAMKYCTTFSPKAYTCKLASIESSAEQQFIETYIMSRGDLNQYGFWVSGNQIDRRLGWVWAGRGQVGFQYTNWAPGEPNGSGVCVQLWRDRQYRWDDVDCANVDVRFICEMAAQ